MKIETNNYYKFNSINFKADNQPVIDLDFDERVKIAAKKIFGENYTADELNFSGHACEDATFYIILNGTIEEFDKNPITRYNPKLAHIVGEIDFSDIQELIKSERFNKALEPIKKTGKFLDFIGFYKKLDDNSKKTSIECLELFNHFGSFKLNSVKEFMYYILDIYFDNDISVTENKEKQLEYIEKIIYFLDKTKLKSPEDFIEKFAHLKPDYKDFKEVYDISAAIRHEADTFDDKTNGIKNALSKNNIKKSDIKILEKYIEFAEFFDYVYDTYGQDYESILTDIMPVCFKILDLDESKRQILFDEFNIDFKNFIQFYKFCKLISISQADVDLVKDKKCFDNALEFPLSTFLLQQKDIMSCLPEQYANNDFYRQNALMLNLMHGLENKKGVDDFLNAKDFLKSSNDNNFLNNFAKMTGISLDDKNISSNDLCIKIANFIELFKFTYNKNDKENRTSDNKACQKDSAAFYKTLNERRVAYQKEKFEIIRAIIESGQEIYSEKDLINIFLRHLKSPQISYEKIVAGNKMPPEQKENYIDFIGVFQSTETAIRLINDNDIKFDNSKESKEYRDIYAEFVKGLVVTDDEEKTAEYQQKLCESGILTNASIGQLKEFLSQDRQNAFQILKTKFDKNTPDTISQINETLSRYKERKTNCDNLINYWANEPYGLSFKECYSKIDNLQNEMSKIGINIKIDESNVDNIDYKLLDKKLTHADLIQLANRLVDNDNFNFIAGYQNAFCENKISKTSILKEIAKIDTNNDPDGNNLIYFLGLEDLFATGNREYIKDVLTSYKVNEKTRKFVDFIYSNDWIDITNEQGKTPNISIHTRLRTIERFILNNYGMDLYSDEAKEKLKNIFKTIYCSTPSECSKSINYPNSGRFVVYHPKQGIKAIFSSNGSLVTVINIKNNPSDI